MAEENEILNNNKLAMKYLQEDNFKATQNLLKQCEDRIQSLPSDRRRDYLLSVTYNNLGCLYKRKNQPKVALEYLKLSLRLDESSSEASALGKASTQQNISALYSALNSHSRAFKYAVLALKTLEDVAPSLTVSTSMVVSYFNAAVELEHLNRLEEAISYYKSGLDIALKDLGESNELTLSIAKALKNTVSKRDNQTTFLKNRQEIRKRLRVTPHNVRKSIIRRIVLNPTTPRVKNSPRNPIDHKTWKIYSFRHSLPYNKLIKLAN